MDKKKVLSEKRRRRIRLKVSGSLERPRLVVKRGLMNMHGQIIDDIANKTLVSLSTQDKALKAKFPKGGGNVKAAEALGELLAAKAKEKGITKVVFDRTGNLYHGRMRAFAEAARKGGLEF